MLVPYHYQRHLLLNLNYTFKNDFVYMYATDPQKLDK